MSLTIYTTCSPIIVGCFLYQNAAMTTPATAGKYSNGTTCWTVSGILGEVTAAQACTTTTTTSTSTSSTSTSTTSTSSSSTTTTTTEAYSAYYADKYECSGCTVDSNVEIAFPISFTPDGAKWYIPPTPDGFSYKLNGGAAPGPGLIMSITEYNSCAAACLIV